MISHMPLALLSLCFVLLCGLLSIGETAISSVPLPRAQAFAQQRPDLGPLIHWQIAERQKVIISILVAHNLFSITASSFATIFAEQCVGERAILWATVIMTFLLVIFADFLPKRLGLALGEENFPVILPFLRAVSRLVKPLTCLLEKIVVLTSRAFSVEMHISSAITLNEIEQIVEDGERSGAIEKSEKKMIDGVIAFDETRVSEIMVPRISMHALKAVSTISEALPLIRQWGHSRVPLYRKNPDDIVGVLYVKDLIPYIRTGKSAVSLRSFMRRPLFVPETMHVSHLFKHMRGKHIHFAVVVDEYGGTAGIVTLEDLLEEIVGDIRDEYDEDSAPIVELSPGTYKVKCSESLEDLSGALEYDFICDDVDSVGGYILDCFEGFPQKGDVYEGKDWNIQVINAEEHRVREVLFIRRRREES